MRTVLVAIVIASAWASTECQADDGQDCVFSACGARSQGCQTATGCRNDSFIDRLFNFRPWTGAETRPAYRVPGLPIGRRYFGGRYFGQFNNRFYGPQYGNF